MCIYTLHSSPFLGVCITAESGDIDAACLPELGKKFTPFHLLDPFPHHRCLEFFACRRQLTLVRFEAMRHGRRAGMDVTAEFRNII